MELRKNVVKGLTWSSISQIGRQVFQFIIVAVLARLLDPNDFGLIGMAIVFIGFSSIVGELGFSGALIQKLILDEELLSTAFWLNLGVGLFLTALFVLSAPWIAGFYEKAQLEAIICVMSVNFILLAFVNIQQALLTKAMDFKALAIRDLAAVIVSGVLGIILALKGFGVWSLVYQFLASSLINAVFLWIFSSWRPTLRFSLKSVKSIVHFSGNMLGFKILNYFSRNLDYLLIGKFLGGEALGYYTLAYKIMLTPLQNISWMIGKVMFPAFSKIQNDLEKVRKGYLRMIKGIALITFSFLGVVYVLAPEFITLIYGEQWRPVILLLQILCLCGIFQSIGTTVGNIIFSQGKADLMFKLQIVSVFIVFISVTIGLNWGIIGVSVFYTVQAIIWTHLTFYITLKLIKLNYIKFYNNLFIPIVIAGLLTILLLFIKQYFLINSLLSFITFLCLVGFFYFLLLLVLGEIKLKNKKIIFKLLR